MCVCVLVLCGKTNIMIGIKPFYYLDVCLVSVVLLLV